MICRLPRWTPTWWARAEIDQLPGTPPLTILTTNLRRKHMKKTLLLATVIAFAPAVWAESIAGLWNATVNLNGTEIPFRIEFADEGANIRGWFFNGEEHENTTGRTFENGSLVLNFESYVSVFKATVKNGVLDGEYSSRRGTPPPPPPPPPRARDQ